MDDLSALLKGIEGVDTDAELLTPTSSESFSTDSVYDESNLQVISVLYHVTKPGRKKEIIAEGLVPYKADHGKYDGCLLEPNAPKGVFFNGSLYKNDLPQITTYPRDGEKGEMFDRVLVDIDALNLKHFHMYLIKKCRPNTYTQVLVAFAHKKWKKANKFLKHCTRLDKSNNPYLVKLQVKDDEGGQAYKWHCLSMESKFMVNIFIMCSSDTMESWPLEWDEVKHI